jgi:flagellar biosynthesis protein FlhG
MSRTKAIQVIAITGGKGGIGKTNISVNLSIALASFGKKVLLLDADLGLANVDVLLGLHIQKNLSHVIKGECPLTEIIADGPLGIKIIPAASGLSQMARLSETQHVGLIHAFSELDYDTDILIVDTAAGISDSVITFIKASQEVILVVCDEPTSLTDAYALMKVLNREHAVDHFRIIANMVNNDKQGRELFAKLIRATDRFLDVTLDLIGSVPYDDNLKKAVQKQKAVFQAFPGAKSTVAFKTIAHRMLSWPIDQTSGKHIAFFLEKLLECA